MKTKPACILKTKIKHERIFESTEFPGEIFISINKHGTDFIYFSNGKWESHECSHRAHEEHELGLLPSPRRKVFYQLKQELEEFLTKPPNLCTNCIHKNEYLLKGTCSKNYETYI